MQTTSENGSMSDNSDTSYCGDDKCSEMKGDDICRDYLRNVCKRGKRCKYRHPSPGEAKELGRKHEYTFCHDYQNSGCRRPSCRFLHCTRDEEDYYKQTGQLPVRLQQAAALGIGVMPNELPLLKGEVPVCKDFLKGQCMRAGRCKYRHVSPPQYDTDSSATKERLNNGHVDAFETFSTDDVDRYTTEYDSSTAATTLVTATKRRRTDDTFTSYIGYHRAGGQTPMDYALLLEENTMLRRKMEELKKQVSDLAATNEVLLEQNARYRASKVNTVTTVPPVVTVSQVLTPTITPAAAMARPHMPHLPQTMAALTTPAQLTVNGNSELVVSQPTLAPLNTPVSVAINPAAQNIVPVSITMDTSIAPPGSMATVTLGQNIGQPPPPVTLTQTTLPTGQTLIGSSLSSALVSYPIMSHCVTQLPTSSLG
ncbi:hypothetical protein LSH36_161g10013 [Paralvinella palmiformis]|uniref:C3H1-type domain-containing protein n=1 Tax=Paralvinella palmiformis TaxID=53620 RepID=A0AAD9JV18_9ANNE|nr:hypothetical protein LSH36_161g10013 [Paralvinella palmiformis]